MSARPRAVAAGWIPALWVSLALVGAGAALAEGAPVSVEYAAPTLTLRVTEATDLRTVLEVLCQRTDTRCDLAPATAEIPAIPGTVTGGWLDVVMELLRRSGLSYTAVPPGPSSPGRLIVRAPGPARERAETTPPTSPEEASQTGTAAGALFPGPGPWPAPSDPSLPTSDETNGTGTAAGAPSLFLGPWPALSDPSSTTSSSGPGPALTGLPGQEAGALAEQIQTPEPEGALPLEGGVVTPFAGPGGRPFVLPVQGVPGAMPAVAVTPYSDARGDPVAVAISNEPLILTPFSDSSGHPVAAPRPIPGQQLEYPIPPTPAPPR